MIIDDYITATRFIKGEAKLSFYYQSMYDSILSLIDMDNLPRLVVCYSTDRRCEFLSFEDDEYIIYDQYLGQTFNMLNRIYFNSSDKYDMVTYAYKILAEIYHSSAEEEISQICYIAYYQNSDEHKTYKKDKNLYLRLQYTYYQEFFVIMHEVAHWYLSKLDKAAFINEKRSWMLDYFSNIENIDDPDEITSILEDIDAVLENPFESYKSYVTPDMYKEIEKTFELRKKDFFDWKLDLIKTSDDFIEECLCDDIATFFFIKIMTSTHGIDIKTCLQIIYIGLQNLEILTILRSEALKKKEGTEMPKYLIELVLRNSQFRGSSLILNNLGFEDIIDCQHKFVNANRKFTAIIKDPVLFLLTNILEELQNIDINGNKPIKVENKQYNEMIRKL